MTRSGYCNWIPRDRSPSGTGPAGSPRSDSAHPHKGEQSSSDKRAPPSRRGRGGRRTCAGRAGRAVGGGATNGTTVGGGRRRRRRSRPAPPWAEATTARAISLPRTATPWRNQERGPSLQGASGPTSHTPRSLSLSCSTHPIRRHRLSLHSSFPRKSYLARRPPAAARAFSPREGGRGSGPDRKG